MRGNLSEKRGSFNSSVGWKEIEMNRVKGLKLEVEKVDFASSLKPLVKSRELILNENEVSCTLCTSVQVSFLSKCFLCVIWHYGLKHEFCRIKDIEVGFEGCIRSKKRGLNL